MNVARPHVAVSPGVEGEALVVLARTTAPLTGRQIARLARRGTSASVSAALDRLADAACCKALGQRSRSQNHRDAIALVRQVQPGGADAARQLERLLGLKHQAHNGLRDVGGRRLLTARRQAHALVAFAENVLGR
jgi:hypothetical protein